MCKLIHLILLGLVLVSGTLYAACVDNVVMIHGNAGYPSHWDNTVSEFKSRGYQSSQIFRPNWGSKTCPACNDHGSNNLNPVKTAISQALASSCTGKIAVMGHSMGVTLAMKAINSLNIAANVRRFVGIAGAQRGLNSCGVYPYNVWTSTCGSQGLSINSPLIQSVRGKRYASKVYSIKSYADEIVCYGSCYVYGVHTSMIDVQDGSYTFNGYGHFGLLTYTAELQADLLR